MKTRHVLFLVVFMILPSVLLAQKRPLINQYNKVGKKEGFWKENIGTYGKAETYYKDGRENGIYKFYSLQNVLEIFGEYKDGKYSGIWYYFFEDGSLFLQINNIKYGIIEMQDKNRFEHSSYAIQFYPNGNKESEGILLWEDDPRMDTSREYGIWKYYDESGKLTKTKTFK